MTEVRIVVELVNLLIWLRAQCLVVGTNSVSEWVWRLFNLWQSYTWNHTVVVLEWSHDLMLLSRQGDSLLNGIGFMAGKNPSVTFKKLRDPKKLRLNKWWRSSSSCTLCFVCQSIGPIRVLLTERCLRLRLLHAGEWQGEKSTEVSLNNRVKLETMIQSQLTVRSHISSGAEIYTVFSRICFVIQPQQQRQWQQ